MREVEEIRMEHGAGGEAMRELLREIMQYFADSENVPGDDGDVLLPNCVCEEVPLDALDDSAVFNGIVFTTDSHTVKPLFFPGGDIGSLSIAGTVNDIAVMGASPVCMSAAFVIEEGFPMSDFVRVLGSMRDTAHMASVKIVTGDTKVVEKGAVDGIIINTSAIGFRTEALEHNFDVVRDYRGRADIRWLTDSNLKDGDAIIVSGYIGDHGIALLSHREGINFDSELKSDIAPLNKLVQEILKVGGIVAMKDPTRGGLANALNEFSEKSGVGIEIEEEKIPIRESVRSACEMLGIDPLEIGNEGKIVMGVVSEIAEDVLRALRHDELGKNAEIIGYASEELRGVVMKTEVGGRRTVEPPIGDPVPRIC